MEINLNEMTVSEAITRYINSKSVVLSPSTIYGYKKVQKEYMQGLMNVPLSEINQEVFQTAINHQAMYHSSKTVRNAYGLVHAALKMFMPEKVFSVTLPPKVKSSFYIPDTNQIAIIYKVIKGHYLEIPFLLASMCGLRPSEICALKKDSINNQKIEIHAAVVLNEKGKEITKPPKSYAGYRTIPISKVLEDKLLSVPTNRICPITPNKISRDWAKFLDRNHLRRFRFYSLRHYFASQSLLLGIPQKYIAEMMGHASTYMIERVYQHTFPSAMAEYQYRITKNMDELLLS